jgi:hypothetical protein
MKINDTVYVQPWSRLFYDQGFCECRVISSENGRVELFSSGMCKTISLSALLAECLTRNAPLLVCVAALVRTVREGLVSETPLAIDAVCEQWRRSEEKGGAI